MTMEEAIEILESLLITLQKFRSNSREAMFNSLGFNGLDTIEGQADRMLADMYPWIHGKKSIIHGVMKALEVYKRDGALEPSVFKNIIFVSHRLQPEIALAYEMRMDQKLLAINEAPYIEWS